MALFWKRLKKATREEEEAFRKAVQDENLGCKDVFAIVASAFMVIVLPCLLVLLALGGLMLLLFQ